MTEDETPWVVGVVAEIQNKYSDGRESNFNEEGHDCRTKCGGKSGDIEPPPRQAYAFRRNNRRIPMSKETLDQFIQQISGSEELQTKIGEEIDVDSNLCLFFRSQRAF